MMNGDLTRDRFDARNGFTAVRAQQGRVMLDADHNEQADIQLDDTRQGRRDLVGESGAPADEPGFGITVAGGAPVLGAGRYTVHGLRVRNPAAQPLDTAQPFLPGDTLPTAAGTFLAYLEAWERPLTAVEEPAIREVALGGPDTTLRDQLVWQVRWLRLGNVGLAATCASAGTALETLSQQFDGVLEPRLQPAAGSGPCIVADAAQFRGLENQLYRAEIHQGNLDAGGAATGVPATFKWSRDNSAVVAGVVGLSSSAPIMLQVDRLGPGGAAGFERGVTIEIRNERAVLEGTPGILARVDDVEGDTLRLSLLDGAAVAALQDVLSGARVIVRRWDSTGALPLGAGFVNLEDGLQVSFAAAGRYRTGDFWLIPARTASIPGTSSALDWPLTAPGAGTYVPLRSRGPVRHRAGLAILERDAAGAWTVRSDCRQLFPPLTSVITLQQAGGDGQHGRSGAWLPAPLNIVLARGRIPVANAPVRFQVSSGRGAVSAAEPSSPRPLSEVVVRTDGDGRARVFWQLGPGPARRVAEAVWEPDLAQSVEVMCVNAADRAVPPAISFVAQTLDHFNLQIAGGNGQQGRPGEILEVALRARVDDGQRVVANAVVEFSILNRIFEGTPLNQDTGGSLLASVAERVVSGDPWPGGTRFHTVRTRTDAEGVAQVQWTLGEHLALTTQRVEARLLDAATRRSDQAALFVAQLALAGEVRWNREVPWLAALLNGDNANVQRAIDEIARRLDEVAGGTVAFNPFLGVRWRATDNRVLPLTPSSVLPIGQFAAVVLREDLVPDGRDLARESLHQGVRVHAELPIAAGAGMSQVVTLFGNLRRSPNGWEWALSSEARGVITRSLNGMPLPPRPGAIRSLPLIVAVVPQWLPGGLPSDSNARHEFLFEVRVGTA
jgi:hypothetical protein